MRRLLPLISLLVLAGCGDPDAGKLFADIQYGTRCPTSNHCSGPEDRDICGINAGAACMGVEGTARVSCSISETADGGNYLLNFSAEQGMGYSISVRNAQVAMSGGFASGTNCSVVIVEGVNRYEAPCFASEPTTAVPGCQLSSIAFLDDMGNPTVEGQIFCRDMPNQANRDLKTDVTQVGSGTAANEPGRFRIANCAGLELSTD